VARRSRSAYSFADVRGYTALVESASPEEAATLLAPFYRAARDVLMRKDAVIDKPSAKRKSRTSLRLGTSSTPPARLQAQAQPAQLILSERLYKAVRERFPAAKPVELKGKSAPVAAHLIEVGSSLMTAPR
jgi:class 3 adenylate cyclase